jgi:hypothetical protein
MPPTTEYRFLTRDETLELDVRVDSTPAHTSRRHFASREELLVFAAQLEAEGWELLSATKRPDVLPPSAEIPREVWIFSRRVHY